MLGNPFLRLLSLAIVLLAVACALPVAVAAEVPDPPDKEEVVEYSPEEPGAIWTEVQKLMEVLEKDKIDELRRESILQNIREIRLNMGISTLEFIPLIMAQEAHLAVREKKMTYAKRLLEHAEQLNPDLASTAYEWAHYYQNQGFGGFFSYVGSLLKAYRLKNNSFWGGLFFGGNLNILLQRTLLLTLVLFTIGLFYREANTIIFDVTRFLPESFNSYGVWLLGLTILMLPVILGVGIMWCLAFWLFLVFGYCTPVEKGIVVTLLLGVAAGPYLLQSAVKSYVPYENERAHSSIYVMRGGWSDEVVHALEERLDKAPADHLSSYFLGLLYKRRGGLNNLLRAEKFFERSVRARAGFTPAYINLGAVQYFTDRKEEARKSFEKATQQDSGSVEAFYNLSRYYLDTLNFKKGEDINYEAQQIDPEALVAHDEVKKDRHWNRHLMEVSVRPEDLKTYVESSANSVQVDVSEEWNSRLLGMGPTVTQIMVVVLILLMFGADFVRPYFWDFSRKCAMSGTPFLANEENKGPYCEQTMTLFFKGDNTDNTARDSWKAHMRRKELTFKAFTVFLTLLAPGTGQVGNERSPIGIVFILIWAFALVSLVFNNFFLAPPLISFDPGRLFDFVLFGVVALGLYVLSFLTLWNEV